MRAGKNEVCVILKNWLRNRNTIELLDFWETIYNPDFKPVEFDGFRKQAGLNSFVMTPKKWIESTNVMTMSKNKKIYVQAKKITILVQKEQKYISLTGMLKAKDGDFFIADWLLNRNTVEYLDVWESVYNPTFNYGEFALIKSQAGLNSSKLSVKEWVEKTKAFRLKISVEPDLTLNRNYLMN